MIRRIGLLALALAAASCGTGPQRAGAPLSPRAAEDSVIIEIASPFHVMGHLQVSGSLCLEGPGYAGSADLGPDDVHLKCGGPLSGGFQLKPPVTYTEPSHFPDATYYYVVLAPTPTVDGRAFARIFDRNANDITSAVGDSLVGIVETGKKGVVYDFRGPGAMERAFDPASGVFRLDGGAGQTSVVVNFGEVIAPYPAHIGDVLLGGFDRPLTATIVNTRFTGASDEQRLQWRYWSGGRTELGNNLVLAPANRVGVIAHDLLLGASPVTAGTDAAPALLYVTHDGEFRGRTAAAGQIDVLHDLLVRGNAGIAARRLF